jgi:D-alanine-D-alanine ligase
MNVVVLAGGTSTERDVSLISGSMIYRALRKNGHNAILIDVYLGYEGDTEDIFDKDIDWTAQIGAIAEKNPDLEKIKALRQDGDKNFFGPNVLSLCQSADAVFMALHGANGEDGKIQACFELMGIPYTGTDYVSSAMAMDKGITKDIFKAHDIPTPGGIRLKKGETETQRVPYPCIVKACCGGSSVGVCVAHDEEEYVKAKEEAFRYDDEVVIEQYISGREFSVGVMNGKALPVIEIAPKTGFYDYKNKYQAGSTVETCPAELTEAKTSEMQAVAEKVFRALRLKNYARMDFMMGKDGDIYCLEANTLPGMTPTSLLPQEAAAVGKSFEELCEEILRSAV